MSDLEAIESALAKTARRRRWFRAWNGLFVGLFVASAIWLVATILFKLLPLPFQIFGVLGGLVVGMVVGGFAWGGRAQESALETARWVDHQLGLKEKLSAAIEFSGTSERWGALLLKDGVKYLDRVRADRLLTYQLPQAARWTVLLLLLSASLGFVPEYRSRAYLDRQREEAVMKETGQRLSSFAQRTLQQRPPKMKPTEKAMVSMDELGKRLTSAKLTRAEAMERIANVTDELTDEAKALGENPAFKRMQQQARTPTGAPSDSAKSLQRQMDALRQKMNAAGADAKAMEAMKQQLDQLQQAAAEMSGEQGGMTPGMKQQAAESMASLSQMAKQQGMTMPELEAAMSAFKNGEIDQFLKALDAASVNLDKMLEMAKAMEKMAAEMAQLGKNLAEQLEKGQAQAASERLLEMAKSMESSDADVAASTALMKELAEALDPAGDYGDVQTLLKKALQQGQEGDRPAAANSLRAAADELKKLMDQFGDMQSLMASLDALKTAQMCVGNGMGWGQCLSKMGGFKPGGKPGAGVGTWADENAGWFYSPELSERWDNSDANRPDMAAKGHTDRGLGERADGMVPTKVKGRFSPGGPMPSITLRGVSIKGESHVRVQEAIATAQDEAQSALSQQKVPRAYQQSVRSYFDDFAE